MGRREATGRRRAVSLRGEDGQFVRLEDADEQRPQAAGEAWIEVGEQDVRSGRRRH